MIPKWIKEFTFIWQDINYNKAIEKVVKDTMNDVLSRKKKIMMLKVKLQLMPLKMQNIKGVWEPIKKENKVGMTIYK